MNVYYISLYYKNNHITGANKRFDEIGKRLLNADGVNLICIVTKNNKPIWCPELSCIELPTYNSFLSRLYLWFRLEFLLLFKKKSVIVNDFMPIPFISKLKGHKLVQLIHDMRNFNEFKRGGLGFLTSRFQSSQLRLASKILTVSEFSANSILESCNINLNNIFVSYNGVTPTRIHTQKRVIDLLYVATFEPRKNHLNLLKAIELIEQPLNIVFVGSDLGMKQTIHELSLNISNKCGHRFHFYDQLTNEELSDIYWRTKVFCSPSFYEGFGIPLIEAILCHCNVACSDIPVFREITLNKCLYFDPKDISQISEKISYLLENNSVDPAFVTSIKKKFDWDDISLLLAEQLKKVYNEK